MTPIAGTGDLPRVYHKSGASFTCVPPHDEEANQTHDNISGLFYMIFLQRCFDHRPSDRLYLIIMLNNNNPHIAHTSFFFRLGWHHVGTLKCQLFHKDNLECKRQRSGCNIHRPVMVISCLCALCTSHNQYTKVITVKRTVLLSSPFSQHPPPQWPQYFGEFWGPH